MKRFYVIRHCKAGGQDREAALTAEGFEQAEELAGFLDGLGIDRIVSSPFLRTQQTIAPFAKRTGLTVELDERLGERVFSAEPLENWMELLRDSYEDMDLCLEGGESSRTAMERGVAVAQAVLASDAKATVIVSHGNLSTLLLRAFDERYGFDEWKVMSNPDVFCVQVAEDGSKQVERIWRTVQA